MFSWTGLNYLHALGIPTQQKIIEEEEGISIIGVMCD